jgi:hypothetical protein
MAQELKEQNSMDEKHLASPPSHLENLIRYVASSSAVNAF